MEHSCDPSSKKVHAPLALRAATVPSSNGIVQPARQQAPE
jgi:hypothetical protein